MIAKLLAVSLLVIPATALAEDDCILPDQGTLQSDTQLNPACVYHGTISIEKPLTLDCRGAIFDGENRLLRGLAIGGKTALAGITVRNCTFRRYTHQGVLIAIRQADDITARITPREARYKLAPQDVLLENVTIVDNDTAGLVIGDYVNRVRLHRLQVRSNAGWGMYWDHDSREIELTDSLLEENGHRHRKQALALDGSSNNRIAGNLFRHNARSAIQLYRNCWEFAASNPHSVLREVGANNNLIENNRFEEEEVGIWIAPRMGTDLRHMQCGRPPYYLDRYVEDEALRNRLIGNRFDATAQPIMVEDDGTVIHDNRFDYGTGAITIGAPLRARILHRPVINTDLANNLADDGAAQILWTDRTP